MTDVDLPNADPPRLKGMPVFFENLLAGLRLAFFMRVRAEKFQDRKSVV